MGVASVGRTPSKARKAAARPRASEGNDTKAGKSHDGGRKDKDVEGPLSGIEGGKAPGGTKRPRPKAETRPSDIVKESFDEFGGPPHLKTKRLVDILTDSPSSSAFPRPGVSLTGNGTPRPIGHRSHSIGAAFQGQSSKKKARKGAMAAEVAAAAAAAAAAVMPSAAKESVHQNQREARRFVGARLWEDEHGGMQASEDENTEGEEDEREPQRGHAPLVASRHGREASLLQAYQQDDGHQRPSSGLEYVKGPPLPTPSRLRHSAPSSPASAAVTTSAPNLMAARRGSPSGAVRSGGGDPRRPTFSPAAIPEAFGSAGVETNGRPQSRLASTTTALQAPLSARASPHVRASPAIGSPLVAGSGEPSQLQGRMSGGVKLVSQQPPGGMARGLYNAARDTVSLVAMVSSSGSGIAMVQNRALRFNVGQ